VAFFLSCTCCSVWALSDAEFEKIISENNDEMRALLEQRDILRDSVEEAEAFLGWRLEASSGFLEDRSPSETPGLSFDSLNSFNSQISLSKKNLWGLETRLGVDWARTRLDNASLGNGVFDSLEWKSSPFVEMRLPLGANAWGRKTRSEYQSAVMQKRLEALQAEAAYDDKMHEALTLLWSTVLQRESLKNQEATLERINKIYAIALSNSKKNLEASSNFLQARSALEQAQLDLNTSKLKFSQLERLLGLVSRRFKDMQIPSYDFSKFQKLSAEEYRSKVSARQRQAALSLDLEQRLSLARLEENRARVDLVGSYSQTGNDNAWAAATGESLLTTHPKAYLGVQMSFPLDMGLSGRSRARQELLARVASSRRQYLRAEQDPVLTEDLVSQHNQLLDLLGMNITLEKTQMAKVTNERKLLEQGRSSIYQVLQFELDLARAQSGKFALALELEKIKQKRSLIKYKTYE